MNNKSTFSPAGVSLSRILSVISELEELNSGNDESIILNGIAAITMMNHYPESMFDDNEREMIFRAVNRFIGLADENA
jgi:hypothetical protein